MCAVLLAISLPAIRRTDLHSVARHTLRLTDGKAMNAASKHAVKVLLEGLRKDLVSKGSKIRVGEVSPGLVLTEGITNVAAAAPKGNDFFSKLNDIPSMESDDVAGAVLYMLSQHPRVQVRDIIVLPTGTPF